MKKKTKKLKTRIAIILDRSSSMMSIRTEAIAAFNQQVESIKKGTKKDMDTKVSLVTFATTADEPTFFNKSVKNLELLTPEKYMPDGMTAMYDAVGRTIDSLKALKEANDEDTSFLVVIISDGQENNSKEFNSQAIAERVKSLQDTKRWTFSYLGANQDLTVVSRSLGLHMGNTMSFNASVPGAYAMAKVNTNATDRYMNARSAGVKSVMDFYDPNADTDSNADKVNNSTSGTKPTTK